MEIVAPVRSRINTLPTSINTLPTSLYKCNDWYEVYEQDSLRDRLMRGYNNIRNVFEDLRVWIEKKEDSQGKARRILKEKQLAGRVFNRRNQGKIPTFGLIACQVIYQRPIKTKQLFIYGPPNTQKTLIIGFLAKVMRIYFASSRRNDFTGADNYYDLLVFDDFHEPEKYGVITSVIETGTAYANTLLISHAFRWSITNLSLVLHYSYRLDGFKLSRGNHFFSIKNASTG
ncbi:conserved hypothetical protein [Ricinus communis]|uniref:Uncharacterized protein n=1 Tax=Ricinus communis TaxID=3988 RepID=B9SUK0_RICCO|nr:conserved hypothetical protein [Ricinus communis]